MKKLLLLVIFIGGFFRFYAVNWDSFGAFHPDERNISWAVTRIKFFDQMNPKFFAYGGFPIYLYRGVGEVVVRVTKNPDWVYDWGHIAVLGRVVSATLSTVSIGLIFLVGTAYFSTAAGLIAATLLAFSPWAIREAHFATTETMLVFFILLLLYLAKTKNILLLGIIWGLAMAAKTTGLLFGVIPIIAIMISKGKIRSLFILCSTATIVFSLFSPYTILDLQHFRESMTYETGVALGRFPVPYTLQFVGTPKYLYQVQTMLWQAGPLVLVGFAGLILLVFQKKYIVLTLFPLLYFAWTGTWFAKFSRYNVPFLPFLTLAAAWLCVYVVKRSRVAGYVFTALLLVMTALWGLANFTIYLRPQTKTAATLWIYVHVPADAIIYTEHWNDGLPLDLPGPDRLLYQRRELLNVYDEPDNDEKRIYLADKLAVGDYIFFSTRRIWATMPKLKERYPVTSVFYEKLLQEELGYTEVATFTSFPKILGLEMNDDLAEESIQVFDHPTVRLFQNTGKLKKEEIYNRLMSSMGS